MFEKKVIATGYRIHQVLKYDVSLIFVGNEICLLGVGTRVEDNTPKTCCTTDISITTCRTMVDGIIKPGETRGSIIESQNPVFAGVGKGRQSNTPTRSYSLPNCSTTHVHCTHYTLGG